MKSTRPETALLAALALLLALALLVAGGYVYRKHQWASARLAELEPRHARTLGLLENRAALEELAIRQAQSVADYAYPPDQDTSQVGNNALQRVRDLLGAANLQVLSSQALPARDDVPGFERIPISVRFEGELAAVQKALAALSAQAPAIVVDSMTLQVNSAVRQGAMPAMACTVNLSVLRRLA